MQEKELRKMGRKELLEMLLEQSKEVNYLKEQLKLTKEQLTFLQEAGCDMIQGYYFYRPMSEEEFSKLL